MMSTSSTKTRGRHETFHRARHVLRLVSYVILSLSVLLLSVHTIPAIEPSKTIAIIRPDNVSAYKEAVDGFIRALRQHDSGLSLQTSVYESSEEFTAARVHAKHANHPTDLIVTVGSSATADMARNVRDIPLVFSMVLNPTELIGSQGNVVGASLHIPYALQFKMIKEVLPQVKTVGVIYNAARNTATVKDMVRVADQFDLRMRTFSVDSQKDIPDALELVHKEADLLLGIVDNIVYTSQTAKYIINYTIKKQLPFIGISQAYVKAGALCSFVFDNRDIGRQAAELALQILDGTLPAALQNTTPEKLNLAINLRTARIIGVNIPKAIRKKAGVVYE